MDLCRVRAANALRRVFRETALGGQPCHPSLSSMGVGIEIRAIMLGQADEVFEHTACHIEIDVLVPAYPDAGPAQLDLHQPSFFRPRPSEATHPGSTLPL